MTQSCTLRLMSSQQGPLPEFPNELKTALSEKFAKYVVITHNSTQIRLLVKDILWIFMENIFDQALERALFLQARAFRVSVITLELPTDEESN